MSARELRQDGRWVAGSWADGSAQEGPGALQTPEPSQRGIHFKDASV